VKGPKRIAMVDDDASIRSSLKIQLEGTGRFRVVCEFERAAAALEALPGRQIDIVLLDVRMPGMDGLECLNRLRELLPGTLIIVFTAYGAIDVLQHVAHGRGNGLVQKGASLEPLLETLLHARIGGLYLPHDGITTLVPPVVGANGTLVEISDRDRRFIELLAEGLANKEIAQRLGLTEDYVGKRLSRLYDKFHCKNRAEAAMIGTKKRS